MPCDGCYHSFERLAQDVLPRYMSLLRQKMTHPIPMAEFAVKGDGPKTLQRRFGLEEDPSACYILIDKDGPVYVGISRSVIKRLREHVGGVDFLGATLAYKIAATRYPHGKTAAQAMEDPDFQLRFQESRSYLRALATAFVEIANPIELYLFEPYCAMELESCLDTGGWNTFETH